MVHISDGILSPVVIGTGWIITAILLAVTLWLDKRKNDTLDEIPKISILTAAFFVASLIHISLGPTTVHLVLNGLLGVVLGLMAYPAMFIGLVLQALLFQHGGITVLGVNTMNVGIPALIVHFIFRKGCSLGINPPAIGAVCGGLATAITAILLAAALVTTGEEFTEVAYAAIIAHIPIIIVEGIITGAVVGFVLKVRPELLKIG
ncbi:cobalt/nickel transport system permease protein [Methanohalophilus levihalophilus]|uniref:cobalt transporter CbiM n=1 Tax=Methanohalophilus levihalophilus TaxID=1431282 RepID=UPI001AE57F29|nr:cobalt transporter CbiM [Methanohalophilus levihalophilus]MBP2030591.1 cobalt/nickel transport system permease protein [Methanohalophilus levihalophilus]